MKKILLALSVLLVTLPTLADDLGLYLQNGYKIIGRSTINESFMGCEWNKTFTLANGQYFMCQESKAARDPRLQNQGYYIDPEAIIRAADTDALKAAIYGGNGIRQGLTPQQRAQIRYEAQIANKYGVPYEQAIQIQNQQRANSYNLPIIILQDSYGSTKYIINGTEYRGKIF